mmetsp:Transcript_15784/g.60087  ORF Transcript_15784/g.60087 Transcript_15784/m.60087 type:complete len:487 (-) Transcript_15784:145-1605(-)
MKVAMAKGLQKMGKKATINATDDGSLHPHREPLDDRDPVYDSEEDGQYYLVATKSAMDLQEFKERLRPIFDELFVAEDLDESVQRITELACPEYNFEVVKRAVSFSLDKGQKQQNLVSTLLSRLHPEYLSSDAAMKGFERLLELTDELELDVPNARSLLAAALARAVQDEVVPVAFLSDPSMMQICSVVLAEANRLVYGNRLTDFKASLKPIFQEFFVSADYEEVARRIQELDCPEYSYEVVKRAISFSLDKRERERELVSKLINFLYPTTLASKAVCKGFERLFELADELALDVPNAKALVATFLARAVVDEVIPPSFLMNGYTMGLGGDVIAEAKSMLNREHASARLDRIWGPGDGRPVKELKVAVDQLLQEYLLAGDYEEASRCVRELSAPFFHHEIVKRAVVTALDKDEAGRERIASLLLHLHKNDIVSTRQFEQGFGRLYGLVSDLVLDVPDTPRILATFAKRAVADGVLPPDFRVPIGTN